jgi:hypothetical protein
MSQAIQQSRGRHVGPSVCFFAVITLGTFAVAQKAAPVQALDGTIATTKNATVTLPKAPGGKSTVIGGEIRDVDPVRDQFTLRVFGGRSMKILFDERTQVFRDGERISELTLRPDDHASVETTLDGTKVFALKIHMLSRIPQGELQGQVAGYDPQTAQLTISPAQAKKPITLKVPTSTPVVRVGLQSFVAGQHGQSDLIPGSRVNVTFKAGTRGLGIATKVDVLAVPGAAFVFNGSVTTFDRSAGRLVLLNEEDNQSYDIAYGPSNTPGNNALKEGSRLKVTTAFDGSRYIASKITIE